MPTERELQMCDIIQVINDPNVPKELVGCLGYVEDATNKGAIKFRVYVPKTIGDWAEYSEHVLPSIALFYVGNAHPETMPL